MLNIGSNNTLPVLSHTMLINAVFARCLDWTKIEVSSVSWPKCLCIDRLQIEQAGMFLSRPGRLLLKDSAPVLAWEGEEI